MKGELAQQLRAWTSLTKDLGSISNTRGASYSSLAPVPGLWHPFLASVGTGHMDGARVCMQMSNHVHEVKKMINLLK